MIPISGYDVGGFCPVGFGRSAGSTPGGASGRGSTRACDAYERTTTSVRASYCRSQLANHVTAMFTRTLDTQSATTAALSRSHFTAHQPFDHEQVHNLVVDAPPVHLSRHSIDVLNDIYSSFFTIKYGSKSKVAARCFMSVSS